MTGDFVSVNRLTWQGQRAYTCPMDSTSNLPDRAEADLSSPDSRPGTLSNSYVYFLGAENGLVKIGFASDYSMRISQLCCSSPVPLFPLAATRGGRVEEREYHRRFKDYRQHGEWFFLTDEIEEEIDRINVAGNPLYSPQRNRGIVLPLTLTRAR